MNKLRQPFEGLAWKASIGWNEHLYLVPSELLEVYSKLIVQKCIEICRDVDGVDDHSMRVSRQDCACEIRDYFGIEQ